ncbi:hypothetical protein HN419_07025 [Candidatus Woesearchaeota archaeon]|jgi:hypothetical protein|nr:hypothetical protein [Candidatus Woesearchaeota archaeon]MBT3538244.1 hypothetical protein [Candidatus Woesearchaeota archaeon]MBT4697698.1 hypothetical protein [Candidatus Woesearchaeota archaeon]MBT4717410.1 hypothetical protein [Candidatus Woesearchaeota archaeon]MBT7105913.1 hypothetical protein [Candidatus Woesearchaeota archaeon]
MKKIIILLGIMILCSTLVLAAYTDYENLGSSGDYKVTYTEVINKGWNLLPADYGAWSITSEMSEANIAKIKAYYMYFPVHKEYVLALSGFSGQDLQKLQSNQNYLQSSAAWFYVTEPFTLSYVAENGGGMPELYKGWNFLTIGPELTVLNKDVKNSNKFPTGDCEVQKMHFWDSSKQNWDNPFGSNNIQDNLDELADDDAVGAGIVIKVKESCQLGVNGATMGPPPLPDSDNTETEADTSTESSEKTCTDTDDNGPYNDDPNRNKVKGTTTGYWKILPNDYKKTKNGKVAYESVTDYCLGEDEWQAGKLIETYCAGNDVATYIVTSCSDGTYCKKGACTSCSGNSCPDCYDSDDSIEEFSSGTTTGLSQNNIFITRSDECINLGGTEFANGQVIVGSSAVTEYSCNNEVVGASQITCEFGCNSGRCMDEDETNSWLS